MLAATSALAVPTDELRSDEELWMLCTEEVKRVCDSFGLALRRSAAIKAVHAQEAEDRDLSGSASRKRERSSRRQRQQEQPESEEGGGSEKHARIEVREPLVATPSSHSLEENEVESVAMELREEEEAVEDIDGDKQIRRAFVLARLEAEELTNLSREMSNKAVDVGAMVVPDAAVASVAAQCLLQNAELLSECFCERQRDQTPLERLGLLQKWWRLVRRGYLAVAVFRQLAASRSKRGGVALFNETVRVLPDACSYVQARRLERIGQLVLRYPRLVYQIQFTNIQDWLQKVSATGGVLLDSLEKILSAEELAFWAMQDNDAVCIICGQGNGLWNCSDCSCWFHEACAGYDQGSLCVDLHLSDGQVIETMVLCGRCIDSQGDDGVDRNFVARDTQEKQTVAAFLNDQNCPYRLRRVVGDGTCLFRVLHDVAMEKLGYAGTLGAFCKKLANAALATTAEAAAAIGEDGVESESVAQLKRIEKSRNPVRDLHSGAWHDIEAEQVLLGFVRLFPRVLVRRFVVHEGAVLECESYGSGDVCACLLQWKVLPHFDELLFGPG